MLVQVAMNGARAREEHPAVPLTPDELAADAAACWAAGARSVHLHPRRAGDERESLGAAAHDAAVAAVRAAVPGIEISCSTQEDIDLGGARDRVAAVRAWRTPPDLVSLNLVQDDAVELGAALLDRGIGIEAGVFGVADAEALLGAPWATWAVVDAGRASGRDVRVGFEDTLIGRDGRPAASNTAQVRALR